MDAAPANSPRIDGYLAESERGSFTSIEIAAPPEAVWDAMGQTTLSECRLTGMLVTLRGLPARLTRRGAFSSNSGDRGDAGASLVINRKGGRFLALDEVPGEELVLGLVGQFWKPSGGTDVTLADAAAFVAFNEPGYVKTAVNFRVEATSDGARLTGDAQRHDERVRAAQVRRLLAGGRPRQQVDPPRHAGRRPPPGGSEHPLASR